MSAGVNIYVGVVSVADLLESEARGELTVLLVGVVEETVGGSEGFRD